MNSEIQEYKEFAEEMRMTLESQFNYQIMTGDKIGAHDTVKRMMEYGIIDKDDARCQPGCPMFNGAGGVNTKDPQTWGYFDYRRKDNIGYIPRYLFCNLDNYFVINMNTLEHWGKRVEGNYEGDIKVASAPVKIRVSQANFQTAAKRMMEDIRDVFKTKNTTFPNFDDMMEMVKAGVVRVFNIEFLGNIISRYRTIGFILVKMDNSGNMTARVIIKYESLYNSWVSIEEFMRNLEDAIHHITNTEISIGYVFNPKEDIERQNKMIKNNSLYDKAREKAVKKDEEKASSKKTETNKNK